MGFFNRLMGREDKVQEASKEPIGPDSSGKRQAYVPMSVFTEFQEEMRHGMRDMRTKFSALVEENGTLKKQLIGMSGRLDEIQQDALRIGTETRKSLSDIHSLVGKPGEAQAPKITNQILVEPVRGQTAAQSSLSSLSTRLNGSDRKGPGLSPG